MWGKVVFWALVGVVAVPALDVGLYDLLVFAPRKRAIRSVIESADAGDRALPARVVQLIRATKLSQSGYVAARMVWHVFPEIARAKHPLMEPLWALLLKLHFSDSERLVLYAALSMNGEDRGLDRLARRKFGKALDALDDREAAQVVTYVQMPGVYERRPELLQQRADWLLARVSATA